MGDLVDYEELESRFKVGRRTIQRWIRSLGFPRPIDLSPGTVRFHRHEVDRWEGEKSAKRSDPSPFTAEARFPQLNELPTEITATGDFAVEMHEQNEKWRDDPDAYVPGPVTFTDLYSVYVGCLRDPITAEKARRALEQRPQLAALLRKCSPF